MQDSPADPTATVREDAVMSALLSAHEGLTPAQSAALDRRLLLMLAARAENAPAAAAAARESLALPTDPTPRPAKAVLHDAPTSSASYRVRIALGLKGIAYARSPVALEDGANRRPAFLARNPQGLVPVLDIDGVTLTQSLAIIGYLDATRPNPPLLPEEPAERARLTALAHAIAMEIAPVCTMRVASHAAGLAGSGEAGRRAWMQHFMGRGLAAVEAMLDHPATGSFVHGAAPGLADCCLVPQLFNARRWGVDLAAMPRLRRIEAACLDLPAFARAHPDRATAQDEGALAPSEDPR
jgi:maleylacetoacetate isomerase